MGNKKPFEPTRVVKANDDAYFSAKVAAALLDAQIAEVFSLAVLSIVPEPGSDPAEYEALRLKMQEMRNYYDVKEDSNGTPD